MHMFSRGLPTFKSLTAGVFASCTLLLSGCSLSTATEGVQDPSKRPHGIEDVDVTLTNGIAPYDHASEADTSIVLDTISRLGERQIIDCVRRKGHVVAYSERAELSRDTIMGGANAEFPFVDRLAERGFDIDVSADDQTPTVGGPLSAEHRAAADACMEELDDVLRAEELFGSIRHEWQIVLDEIDASDEVLTLRAEFAACMREEGIPSESAANELAFLSYVDARSWRADTSERHDIAVTYGKLYVECGRELFLAKERLRGGELRAAFLAQHAEAIRELAGLIEAGGR